MILSWLLQARAAHAGPVPGCRKPKLLMLILGCYKSKFLILIIPVLLQAPVPGGCKPKLLRLIQARFPDCCKPTLLMLSLGLAVANPNCSC